MHSWSGKEVKSKGVAVLSLWGGKNLQWAVPVHIHRYKCMLERNGLQVVGTLPDGHGKEC